MTFPRYTLMDGAPSGKARFMVAVSQYPECPITHARDQRGLPLGCGVSRVMNMGSTPRTLQATVRFRCTSNELGGVTHCAFVQLDESQATPSVVRNLEVQAQGLISRRLASGRCIGAEDGAGAGSRFPSTGASGFGGAGGAAGGRRGRSYDRGDGRGDGRSDSRGRADSRGRTERRSDSRGRTDTRGRDSHARSSSFVPSAYGQPSYDRGRSSSTGRQQVASGFRLHPPPPAAPPQSFPQPRPGPSASPPPTYEEAIGMPQPPPFGTQQQQSLPVPPYSSQQPQQQTLPAPLPLVRAPLPLLPPLRTPQPLSPFARQPAAAFGGPFGAPLRSPLRSTNPFASVPQPPQQAAGSRLRFSGPVWNPPGTNQSSSRPNYGPRQDGSRQ